MPDSPFERRSIYRPRGPRRLAVAGHKAQEPRIHRFSEALRRWRAQGLWQAFARWVRCVRIARVLGAVAAAGLLASAVLWLTLPNIDDPATLFAPQSTVILDRNGVELYRLFSEQDRTYVSSAHISEHAKKATIAIEDERFFDRGCIDVIGFTRAVLSQILPGLFVRSGGSTLTQQFAKNALVGRKRTIIRKVRELMLACKLEQRYDKDLLLELYLNWIPYGHNAYGIEQASRNYFGISAKDLSLAQAAVLAALPQRPSYFSPYGKHLTTDVSDRVRRQIDSGKIIAASQVPKGEVVIGLIGRTFGSGASTVSLGGRTDQVLQNMLEQGMISEAERRKALAELRTMTFRSARDSIRAPHFALWVERQVQELLGVDQELLERGGFRVVTTLDWKLQEAAEKVIASHREDITRRFGAHNAALVALQPGSRQVLTYVGNTAFDDEVHQGKIDMARVPRQPGSSFKLFTYAAAFERGLGPGSVLYDIATKFGDDEPQNFDGSFWGLMTVRTALGASRNIPAIKAFFLAGGEEEILTVADRLGVESPLRRRAELRMTKAAFSYGWPLAIGAAEVPLTEMVNGYATVADGGRRLPVVSILNVTDRTGNIRYAAPPAVPEQVLDARIASQLTSILSDASVRPNEYWRSILSVPGFQTAAKTGTSNKCLERKPNGMCTLRRPESVWTLGYTPNIIVGVWVGNATSQSLYEKADGLTTAAPLWHDFLVLGHGILASPVTSFSLPTGIVQPLVSRLSGELASPCTPVEYRQADLFLAERMPMREDTACVLLNVDKVTGFLSSPACPADVAEERAFFVPQSEAPDRWPLWEKAVQEWATRHMELWKAAETHSGAQLPLPLPPTEECDPALTPGRFQKPEVSLLSPLQGAAVPYPSFTPVVRVQSISPVSKVQYFVDGKPLRELTEEPWNQSVRVPRTIGRDGTHLLKVLVIDAYFNEASDEVEFRFRQ